jgi:AbrB family looped-hinge helix DNA binding protein
MKSIVSKKGQATIPKPIHDRLGLKPGQVLIFEAEGGKLVATKAPTEPHETATQTGKIMS